VAFFSAFELARVLAKPQARRTRRICGGVQDAKATYAQMLLELQAEHRREKQNTSESLASGLLARSGSCRSPTLAEWLTGRYGDWQKRAENESTRRKLDSPKRYLLASDLGDLPLREIDTAHVNAYVEWRLEVGTLTFATRKDGEAYRPRAESVGAQTINKSLKLLSAAL
jgi:hypothetical protein